MSLVRIEASVHVYLELDPSTGEWVVSPENFGEPLYACDDSSGNYLDTDGIPYDYLSPPEQALYDKAEQTCLPTGRQLIRLLTQAMDKLERGDT